MSALASFEDTLRLQTKYDAARWPREGAINLVRWIELREQAKVCGWTREQGSLVRWVRDQTGWRPIV